MICAACSQPSGKHPFCVKCWKDYCPEPTRQAFRSGQANEKRVAEMINLRRQSIVTLHGGDKERRRGQENIRPVYAQNKYRK